MVEKVHKNIQKLSDQHQQNNIFQQLWSLFLAIVSNNHLGTSRKSKPIIISLSFGLIDIQLRAQSVTTPWSQCLLCSITFWFVFMVLHKKKGYKFFEQFKQSFKDFHFPLHKIFKPMISQIARWLLKSIYIATTTRSIQNCNCITSTIAANDYLIV